MPASREISGSLEFSLMPHIDRNAWKLGFLTADALTLDKKLRAAYRLYRRLYDRLPFEVAEGHAHSLGKVVRTYQELGKTEELKFLSRCCKERLRRSDDPLTAYCALFLDFALKTPGYVYDGDRVREVWRDLSDPKLRFNLGLITISQKLGSRHFDDALALALATTPRDSEEAIYLALWKTSALHHTGKLQAAEVCVREAMAWMKDGTNWHLSAHALYQLGLLYRDQNRWQELGEVARRVRRHYPKNTFRGIHHTLRTMTHSLHGTA
jgi:hypothetical protein